MALLASFSLGDPHPPPPLALKLPRTPGEKAYNRAWNHLVANFQENYPEQRIPSMLPYVSPSVVLLLATGDASPLVMPPATTDVAGGSSGGGLVLKKSCSFKGSVNVASFDKTLSPSEPLISREEVMNENSCGGLKIASEGSEAATPRD